MANRVGDAATATAIETGQPHAAPGGQDLAAQHLNTRVVWYYYVGNRTQQEIADELGITRLRVNRIIGQARLAGAVNIEIRMPLAECVALEQRLKARYGLRDVTIVPSLSDIDQQKRVIGEATGTMLDGLLRAGQTIGVGWGQTLLSVARKLTRTAPDGRVIAMMGRPDARLRADSFEAASELARVLGAECQHIPSLLYYPDQSSFAALQDYQPLAAVLEAARGADIGLVTCGDLSDQQQIFAVTSITQQEIASLRSLGAVGEILGMFLDADGAPVDHPLNRRIMALAPSELRMLPDTILAAGGLYKLTIVRSVILGGYVKRLVTDEAVAKGLLAAGDAPPVARQNQETRKQRKPSS